MATTIRKKSNINLGFYACIQAPMGLFMKERVTQRLQWEFLKITAASKQPTNQQRPRFVFLLKFIINICFHMFVEWFNEYLSMRVCAPMEERTRSERGTSRRKKNFKRQITNHFGISQSNLNRFELCSDYEIQLNWRHGTFNTHTQTYIYPSLYKYCGHVHKSTDGASV